MIKTITYLGIILINLVIIGAVGTSYVVYNNIQDLPDYKQLETYEPPIVTRFYSADGKLLEEYAKERRLFIPINAIPKQLQQAFIAAEDKNFYEHPGIDISGITRAIIQNLINISQNKKSLVGGSTITQQVVKNFLLSNEKTLSRKIKEAVLSFRITNVFSKDKILELYLNQIYLGSGAYGVASAALTYFNKSINELDVEESALLAALPKAPNSFNPRNDYDKAIARRNWVLERMLEEGYISKDLATNAISKPIILQKMSSTQAVKADYFAEAVRKRIAEIYGEKTLYEGGLYIRTTLDPKMQRMAENALRKGIIDYDKRHGYRGVVATVKSINNWQAELANYKLEVDIPNWYHAVILSISNDRINIATNKEKGSISKNEFTWALGNKKTPESKFKIGSIIIVEKINDNENNYALRQIPKVNGGIVVMDPHLGRILAMVGGFDYNTNKFNRVDQAFRQPGSAFKPFVYLTAIENGFTPSTLIVDGPIEIDQGPGLPLWRPKNYYGNFLGPTTLRRGLELSRNTMAVNLAQMLGIAKIIDTTRKFGINKNPPAMYSMVLGAMETTLLNMTNAYAMIVNGGKTITPSLIEKIQDRNGKVIYHHDSRKCVNCSISSKRYNIPTQENQLPFILEDRESIADERSAFQIISILEGVIQHTSSSKMVRDLGKTLAGKTGTTNESRDSWFIGFSPDLVVGTYIGFDEPKSLGKSETGATVAEPVFAEFMKNALKNEIDVPFRIPPGIKLVKVNYETGKPSMSTKGTIYETFKTGTEPKFVDLQQYSENNDVSRKIIENDNIKKKIIENNLHKNQQQNNNFSLRELY